MGKFLIGGLVGIIVGAALIFFTLVGVPKASKVPGKPIAAPDATSAGQSAEVVLTQDLFNNVLGTIFRDMNPPAFHMSSARKDQAGPQYASFIEQQACDGDIKILQQGSGVTTSISFENDRISAPLAFAGSIGTPFGCVNFTGWANSHLELRYDAAQKVVYGQAIVDTVNLDGVNPVIGGLVTPFVQSTLNERVNPIQILDAKQLAINLPIASAGGNLQAQVNDVRAEVKDSAMHLFVAYDLRGVRAQ